MRPILATAIATLSLALVALSQEDAPKAKVSSDPLTEEQIAVYRTVFDSYSNGSNATLKWPTKQRLWISLRTRIA